MTTEKGGRPRALTLEQIRRQQPLEARNNEKEGKDSLATNSLTELKRLWCSHKSNGSKNTAKAGGPYQELPLPGGKVN